MSQVTYSTVVEWCMGSEVAVQGYTDKPPARVALLLSASRYVPVGHIWKFDLDFERKNLLYI